MDKARHSRLTYFAVIGYNSGYMLDVYPQEQEKYRKQLGKSLIGEYASAEEAALAILRYMTHSNRRGIPAPSGQES